MTRTRLALAYLRAISPVIAAAVLIGVYMAVAP